ncbi:MAG: 23S rRNA (uracil(1939)-C(5))-methyltransferase RlmD [Prevotellaceae bacterium]|jgi:23S rRNA (uracil1939-C5)-methyltransferase|nr:23S rRNA (uracil(1939)-C(5))-methyltransferase RlmD [Prevotellaceae bacterium]
MKRKPLPILDNILITGLAAEGKSLAHVDGKALFVPHAVPGDVVNVQLIKKRKGFLEGRITQIVAPSDDRVAAFCPHYETCGGCSRQTLPYPMQLQYKQQQVFDQLTRIGKLELPPLQPVIGAEQTLHYRNKLEFTFSSNRWLTAAEAAGGEPVNERRALGFHIPGRFDKVLDIDRCCLQPEPSNAIRSEIKAHAIKNNLPFFDLRIQQGFLRNLIIRNTTTGEWMVIVVFACDDPPAREALLTRLRQCFPQITSLLYVINGKRNDTITDLPVHTFAGRDYIEEQMEGLHFKISPKSFCQTNPQQACRLYGVVRDMAQLSGRQNVYDLYTGTGTIALFVARQARQVTGVEYVPEAVEDARQNALRNNIRNASFHAGDMKDILSAEFIRTHGVPDVVILDPPRAGIHPGVAETLRQMASPRLIYVSCNPATQARDLALLAGRYAVECVQPVDMFPHTHHIENVVKLVLH